MTTDPRRLNLSASKWGKITLPVALKELLEPRRDPFVMQVS